MIDINRYIAELTEKLENTFAERLLYVGLQGSYLRGEANGNSDIDIMAVIDGLDAADLAAYRSVEVFMLNQPRVSFQLETYGV